MGWCLIKADNIFESGFLMLIVALDKRKQITDYGFKFSYFFCPFIDLFGSCIWILDRCSLINLRVILNVILLVSV